MKKAKYKIGDIFYSIQDGKIGRVMINKIEVKSIEGVDECLGKNIKDTYKIEEILYRLATDKFYNDFTDITEERIDKEFFTSKEKLIEYIQKEL